MIDHLERLVAAAVERAQRPLIGALAEHRGELAEAQREIRALLAALGARLADDGGDRARQQRTERLDDLELSEAIYAALPAEGWTRSALVLRAVRGRNERKRAALKRLHERGAIVRKRGWVARSRPIELDAIGSGNDRERGVARETPEGSR